MKKGVSNQLTAGPVADGLDSSDEELLLRYREQNDRAAFEELVHRYEHELYSYLRRYLGDAALAEDAFQQTFLQLHLKRDQFEADRKVRPWLYTIATNQAIDTQRRNKRHRVVSLDRNQQPAGEGAASLLDTLMSREPAPLARMELAENRQLVREAVDNLPEFLRMAVILIYYQGLKYREAADVLGIPVGTVKSRMHTALAKLSEAWSQAEEPQTGSPSHAKPAP